MQRSATHIIIIIKRATLHVRRLLPIAFCLRQRERPIARAPLAVSVRWPHST